MLKKLLRLKSGEKKCLSSIIDFLAVTRYNIFQSLKFKTDL